jgi:uncharacterized membrane protein YfcA
VSAEAIGLLALAAVATSALSAVVGMAGGIALLGVLLLFLDPLVAIPLHAVVQLVSNASRTVAQREHVDWTIARAFVLPLLPAGALGLAVGRELPPDALRIGIAALVLVATWRPQWLRLAPDPDPARIGRRFFSLGAAIGFLNVTIGATGVLAAPFFQGLGLSRREIVGSQALCQAAGHVAKIALFGLAGFAFRPHALLLAALCVSSLAGTLLGTALLERVDERTFTRVYRVVLSLLAAELLLEGVGI